MAPDNQFFCPLETSKLLCLIGLVVFTSVVVVQYFELPCGNVVSNLFSATTSSSVFSSINGVHEIANLTTKLGSKMTDPTNDSVAEKNGDVNNSLKRDEDRKSSLDNAKATEFRLGFRAENLMVDLDSTSSSIQGETIASNSEDIKNATDWSSSRYFRLPQWEDIERNKEADTKSFSSFTPEVDEDVAINRANETSWLLQSYLDCGNSSTSSIPVTKEISKRTEKTVFPVAAMNKMLLLSHTLPLSNSIKLCSLASDQELLRARSQIKNAPILKNKSGLYAPIYWNISQFKRSYELMEQTLKVYIYREGKPPVFHHPRLKGIYASEGWFMKLLEASKKYITTNPSEAHLFYLPFSSQMLEETIYVPNSHSFDKLIEFLKNYLETIKARYPFWNRTSGADHFLVACHDWAPEETRFMPNCIRAVCNADMKEGFQLGKDVSLPETSVQSTLSSPRELEGRPPSQRHILAFFAGRMHGYVRPILLKYWENKDPDMKIVRRMRKASYMQHMKSSKYCICARGYEVNSPRLVEAIMYGCVPVIISDNFVPPFLEVLNWEKIAVFLPEKDISNLKNTLLSISERRYLVMQRRIKMLRQHFLWHPAPVKYDIFHMILHSIWYNRVFQMREQ